MFIRVIKIKEAGYEEAMLGLTLSHGATIERAEEIATLLAHKQGGHNKFLESIMVWIDVNAPRYWWCQMDTYRIGTKQSESTMHTILKRDLTKSDFINTLPDGWLETLNAFIKAKDFDSVKRNLPEGFMQRRIMCFSYKTLQNIIMQRRHHKLLEWQIFCDDIIASVDHPEFFKKCE